MLFVESVGDNPPFLSLSCLRRPTFFLQQKKVGKKCRSQTPRGYAQRKPFVGHNIMLWPAQLRCYKDIRCETDSRAVHDGFD